jgi:antitoxin component YwqK of YwqJK toxin-antitoxin module
VHYVGNFKGGKYDGEGKLFSQTGECVFTGKFTKGIIQDGFGLEKHSNGLLKYKGNYLNGMKHYWGDLYDANG